MREGKQATVGPSRLWLRSADRGVGVEASAARAPPWRSGRTVGCVQDEPCWAPLHARNTATSCGVGVICCATRLCDLCDLAKWLVLNGIIEWVGQVARCNSTALMFCLQVSEEAYFGS